MNWQTGDPTTSHVVKNATLQDTALLLGLLPKINQEAKKSKEIKKPTIVVLRRYKSLCTRINNSSQSSGIIMRVHSSATDHMSPRIDSFKSMVPYPGEVTVGVGKSLRIKGTVIIHMSDECGRWGIALMEVLYVYNLQDNLIQEEDLKLKVWLL